jgi:hypothetical protein
MEKRKITQHLRIKRSGGGGQEKGNKKNGEAGKWEYKSDIRKSGRIKLMVE